MAPCGIAAMKARIGQFRQFVTMLAIAGSLLNAWVLTGHTISVVSRQLSSTGAVGIADCRHHGAPSQGTGHPAQDKGCPICSGLVALDLALLGKTIPLTRPSPQASVVETSRLASVVDHRPTRILNRGPPLVA